MSSDTSRSTAATGKAYRALKELARAALATLSAALATAPEPYNPAPAPDPDPTTLTPTQVEQQCNDPQLMHCGLEKSASPPMAASSGSRPTARRALSLISRLWG